MIPYHIQQDTHQFYFIFSNLTKLNLSEFVIKLFYIHVNLLLPIFFYKSLKIKFKNVDT